MSKKPIIGGIILAAIIGMVFVGAQINPDNPENEKSPNSEVWSARIAGPEYDDTWNHRYSPITLERKVPYEFDFVAMGDSPKWIKIYVNGHGPAAQAFSEMLYLEGTLVDTGISEYYTWDYVGNKNFEISDEHCSSNCTYQIIVWRNVWYDDGGIVTISLSQ